LLLLKILIMVSFEELIKKVEEAEKKYVECSDIPERKERFYLYLSKYRFGFPDSYASFSFTSELENVDKDFVELLDHRLLDNSNGDEKNFGETRQLLYEKIDKLLEVFGAELDKEVEEIERKISSFDTNEQISDIHQFKKYAESFSNFVWGNSPHNQTRIIISDINYKGIRDKIYKIIEKLGEKAWEMVGFSQPETKILQQNFRSSYYFSDTDAKQVYRCWPNIFLQNSIVNKKYYGFDPLKFTFKEIHNLVNEKYQPNDLDEQGKYRGYNPLEKSKTEWYSILNSRKWPQGKIISSVVLVAAVAVAGFSFILKKSKKNAYEQKKKKKTF
jgi:hypothetical protein